jgi:acetamidase/formamidase
MSMPDNPPRRSAQQLHAPSVIAYALLFAAGAPAVDAAEHMLSPQTVHIGYFLSSVKPVLAINSGDIVIIESVASIVPSVVDQSGVVPPSAVPQYQRDIYGEVKDRGPGPHILTGPIEVRGADPGDVLEVRILEINLAIDYGFNRQRSYRGKFQFIVHKGMKLVWPRAETPTHWIVMGLHPNLEEAMKIAVRETIDFITKRFPNLTREEAYMIASVAVDYHVTQVVDGTKGIHGMIPKSIFTLQR